MEIKIVIYLLTVIYGIIAKEDPAFWRNAAKSGVLRHLYSDRNTNVARNVVLMIGDGMGISSVTAARILKGQLQNRPGEETVLSFEEFPYSALSKVYSVNKQVPDSAATATCMLSGVKTLNRVLGVDSDVTVDKCKDLTNHKLSGMMHWSQNAGKRIGIVTTARVTHATPAAMYAATVNRDWESDHSVPKNTGIPYCTDIASQLVHNNSDIGVILGGGRRNFIPNTTPDPVTNVTDFQKQRFDGQNLIETWIKDKETKNASKQVVYTREQFEQIDTNKTDYLLGLFRESHMSYDLERRPDEEPSLAEMTRKAIEILNRSENGYFLMVEGARIDHGHHENKAKKALYDLLAFEEAVKVVADMTDQKDTLIIVTADHSHSMTISGYPDRGNGILDLVKEDIYLSIDKNELPYTTISYANGNSYFVPMRNLTLADTEANNFRQTSAVPMDLETHSGEDVAIYARGPMAHLISGVLEQNVIAYVMAHAACVGDTGIPCDSGREISFTGVFNSASTTTLNNYYQFIMTILVVILISH